MLGPRVNALSVAGLRDRIRGRWADRSGRQRKPPDVSLGAMASLGHGRPVAVLIPTLAFLLILGTTFLRLAQGIPDASVLPPGIEAARPRSRSPPTSRPARRHPSWCSPRRRLAD
jgi:hypothetical protein